VHCGGDLLCNEAYEPPECRPPAEDPGAPCLLDAHCAGGLVCAPDGTCSAGELDDACVESCAPGLVCNQWYAVHEEDQVARCTPPGELGDLCQTEAECVSPEGTELRFDCVAERCAPWLTEVVAGDVPGVFGQEPTFLAVDRDGAIHGATTDGCYVTDRFGALSCYRHYVGSAGSVFFVGIDELLFAHVLSNASSYYRGDLRHGRLLVSHLEAVWERSEPAPGLYVPQSDYGPPQEDGALGPGGVVHVVFCSADRLWHVTDATGEWERELVEDEEEPDLQGCYEPSVAVTDDGIVHVAYGAWEADEARIRHARLDNRAWTAESVGPTIRRRGPLGLVLGEGGQPHVLVGAGGRWDEEWRSLHLYRPTDDGWEGEEVLGVRVYSWLHAGYRRTLHVDAAGHLHLVVPLASDAAELRRGLAYVTDAGGDWAATNVSTADPDWFRHLAVTVDDGGRPSILHWSRDPQNRWRLRRTRRHEP